MRAGLQSIAALSLLLPSLVFAISPARPSQVLCGSAHIVVGTVLKATSKDCRIEAKLEGRVILDCGPKDLVGLIVEISEVLGQKNEVADYPREVGIAAGKTVELTGALHNSIAFPLTESYDRIGVVPPSSEPITNEVVSKIFEGQQFIFSIHLRRGDVWSNGQVLRHHLDTPPYHTGVWRLAKRDWITELLKNSDGKSCPKPVSL